MATTSVKRRPGTAKPKGASQRTTGAARPSTAQPTKESTRPDHEPTKAATKPDGPPQKAHKPKAAAKAGGAKKARKPRSAGTPRQAKGQPPKAEGAAAEIKDKAGKVAKAAAELVPISAPGNKLTRKLALKAAKVIGTRMLRSAAQTLTEVARPGAGTLREAAHHVIDAGATSVEVETSRRPPIQLSVDAGVPIRMAWAEWMKLTWLPEGVGRVIDIERDDDGWLTGRIDGSDADWDAEILDEREQESFAWLSHEGSDCSGLVIFHELGERLTRIELNLDVVPKTVGQAATLSTRVADRRARADLRRFKARLELINPDLYEDDDRD